MASWIRSSGRSLVMTTLTMVRLRRRPDDDGLRRSPVLVSRRRPGRPAIVGVDCPMISVRFALRRAGRVEVGRAAGGQPGAVNTASTTARSARRSRSRRRSGSSMIPAVGQDPRFSGVQLRPGVEPVRGGLVIGRRDQRLELRVGAGRATVAVHGPRRVERRGRGAHAAAPSARHARRARSSDGGRTAGARREALPEHGPNVPATGWCAAGTWYERPGWCARAPDHRPGRRRDKGAIALARSRRLVFCLRRPAIEPGVPGASVTEQETDARSRRFGAEDPGSGSRAE